MVMEFCLNTNHPEQSSHHHPTKSHISSRAAGLFSAVRFRVSTHLSTVHLCAPIRQFRPPTHYYYYLYYYCTSNATKRYSARRLMRTVSMRSAAARFCLPSPRPTVFMLRRHSPEPHTHATTTRRNDAHTAGTGTEALRSMHLPRRQSPLASAVAATATTTAPLATLDLAGLRGRAARPVLAVVAKQRPAAACGRRRCARCAALVAAAVAGDAADATGRAARLRSHRLHVEQRDVIQGEGNFGFGQH